MPRSGGRDGRSGESLQAHGGKADDPDVGDIDRHISGSMTAVAVRYVERLLGPDGVVDMLRRAEDPRSEAEIVDVGGWSSYAQACALFEAAAAVTGDADVGTRIGEEMLRQHAGTEVAALLRSLGSPGELLRNIAATGAKYSTVTEFAALRIDDTSATISTRTLGGFTRHPLMCGYVAGLLSQVSVLYDMERALVTERECQLRGAPQCVYDVEWDPATSSEGDPAHRVAQLEAQLAALTERFELLQATATEMVTPTDVETLLARIARRASLTVRAPGHVLAVRLPGEEQTRTHAHGLAGEDAAATVEDILARDVNDPVPGRLVVEVASARHQYGRLAALYPGSATFFPHERRLLAAYAAQAAAALDTATALTDVRRRNDTARALLKLSLDLADLASPDEVAVRLAATVPDVVDCDHASVFLWDPATEHLSMKASTGLPGHVVDVLSRLAISPADTPLLDDPHRGVTAFFLDRNHPDPFARHLLEIAESVATVVVPIRARGEFYGVVTAGVATDGERLRSNEDVLERLAGLAAQSSAALRNASLLNEVSHRAMHDPLTGLPNRALFRDRLSHALLQARRAAFDVGVLFVDLDGFKQINDTHGHAVGDDVIVAAAHRIRGVLRPSDTVARLGGDEFAVVLPELWSDESCAVVCRKVLDEFRRPLTVGSHQLTVTASIGAAAGSQRDSYDGLVKRADLAMYEAKHAGRNTYVVASQTVGAVPTEPSSSAFSEFS